jgi:hypothetical protein
MIGWRRVKRASRCTRCQTSFEPWKLQCPSCGKPLPIVGAILLILIILLLLVAQAIANWLAS